MDPGGDPVRPSGTADAEPLNSRRFSGGLKFSTVFRNREFETGVVWPCKQAGACGAVNRLRASLRHCGYSFPMLKSKSCHLGIMETIS